MNDERGNVRHVTNMRMRTISGVLELELKVRWSYPTSYFYRWCREGIEWFVH